MQQHRVKHKSFMVAVALLALCVLIVLAWFTQVLHTPATHPPREGRLVVAYSTTHDDHVDFYQNGDKLCYDSYSASPLDKPEYWCKTYKSDFTLTTDNIYLNWIDKNGNELPKDNPNITGAYWEIDDRNNHENEVVTGGWISFIDKLAPAQTE